MLRRGRKSAAQTPAPAKDRIYGSKTNPKGSASSGKSGNSINLSDKTVLLLRKKLKEFKEKHPTKNNITLGDLKAVYRRGLGAYSSTHRPFITGGAPNSRSAWATARVNKFLLKAGGTKVKAAYVQDDDLMAKGGQIDDGKVNFGSPNVDWSEVPFIHETDKVSAENIINEGFVLKAKNNTNGIYTIPYGFKNEKFDKNKVELLVWLKPNAKILWTNSKTPSDFYVGYGNKFYQNIYKELNPDWESTLKNQGEFIGSKKQGEFCRNLESWLKENGYCGVQQGGEYVITDLSCVDYIEYKDDEYADGGLIAPNGKPSNLTPEQYKLVRTPEFKAWFGDWENNPEQSSKVVDENGEPLVVYHGSRNNFYQFDENKIGSNSPLKDKKGFFFTSVKEEAKEYGNVINVFLSIKNSLIVDTKDKYWTSAIYYWDMGKSQYLYDSKNNDGIIILSSASNVYVAFHPEQIKLADGTNNTFDFNNPDIRYADGGLIAPNGKTSNLTPEQYELVRTPEFKAWFGDWENNPEQASKVVDENGEPLVVYHGTSALFNIFKEQEKGSRGGLNEKFWSFTTNVQQALVYALDTRKLGRFSEPRILPVFLDIKDMPTYDNEGKFYRDLQVSAGYKDIDIFQLQDFHSRGFNMGVEFKEVDGFCVKNTIEMEKINSIKNENELIGDTYYVRNSNQIKLADGTNTTFDENNTDIRFEKGGTAFNDAELLRKYKAGESIGFTAIAHLKAKGLIPRADGTKRKSDKYKEDGGEINKNSIKLPELDMQYENLKKTLDYQGYVLEPKLAKGGKLKGSGDCYLVAGKIAMGDYKDIDFIGTPYVVHAEVEGQGKISGIKYGHAWVEDDVNVYDYSNGNEFVLPKMIYYAIGNIKTDNPKKYRRYTFDQARLKMLETKNYGCWDLDVKYDDGGETETITDTVNLRDFESKIMTYKRYIDNQVLEKTKDKSDAMVKVITKHFDDLERKNIIYVLGGNTNGQDLEDISKKHNKSIEFLLKQYFKGLQDELVHVKDMEGRYSVEDFKRISQIVLDHLEELPNYYEVNKVVEQKIEQQKEHNFDEYLKYLNTMIQLINEDENNIDLEKRSNEEDIDLEKLLSEEDEYMQQVNSYLKENNPNYLADGGEISQEMKEKIAEMGISVRTGTDGQVFIGGLKNKNKLYKDEKGYFLIEGYGKFMNKKYPIKKYFTESENETLSYFMRNEYANGGETTIYNNLQQEEMVLEDYFEREKTLADALLLLNRTKIYKVMYCNKKIEYAEKEENMTESAYDKNAWNYVANIWKSTLGVIKAENTEYKHGGTTDCGCMHKYGKGGLAYGNSHDNGGIKATVASTGQSIEYEGGEGVINKRSMQIEKTYTFNGKKLTPCEIVSEINEMGGGVKFKCEDVKPIIANDGSYK